MMGKCAHFRSISHDMNKKRLPVECWGKQDHRILQAAPRADQGQAWEECRASSVRLLVGVTGAVSRCQILGYKRIESLITLVLLPKESPCIAHVMRMWAGGFKRAFRPRGWM